MARGYLASDTGDKGAPASYKGTGPVTGSANVFAGTGIIHTVTILAAGASCDVYDNTNASGTKFISLVPTATEIGKTIILDQEITTGLTYNSAASIAITYKRF
jgi:hypothetical protein